MCCFCNARAGEQDRIKCNCEVERRRSCDAGCGHKRALCLSDGDCCSARCVKRGGWFGVCKPAKKSAHRTATLRLLTRRHAELSSPERGRRDEPSRVFMPVPATATSLRAFVRQAACARHLRLEAHHGTSPAERAQGRVFEQQRVLLQELPGRQVPQKCAQTSQLAYYSMCTLI